MKRTLFLIIILTGIFTEIQAQTIPQFNAVNPRNNKTQSLYFFLGSFDVSYLNGCVKATGTIKFKLNKKNEIDTIAAVGNLPDTLVVVIKNKIKATENH